jgi:hypothetical protein
MRKLPALALAALLAGAMSAAAHQIPTHFIKVHRISPERAAAFLNVAFAPPAAAELPEGLFPVQVVPAHRTSEVFVMGRAEDIRRAEAMLRLLDRLLPVPWL